MRLHDANAPLPSLGAWQATYRGDVARPLFQGIGSLVGGLLLLAAAVALLVNGFIGGLIALLFLTGSLLTLMGPLLVVQAVRSFGAHVTLYDGGITLNARTYGRRHGARDVIPWEDMAQFLIYPLPHHLAGGAASQGAALVRRRWHFPTLSAFSHHTRTESASQASQLAVTGADAPVIRYVIVLRNGSRISLVGYQRLPELAASIERAITERIYPQVVATYQAGTPLPLGPFWLHRVGITAGQVTMPWAALADARIRDGELCVTWRQLVGDPPLVWHAPLGRIPNAQVALRLIGAIRNGRL